MKGPEEKECGKFRKLTIVHSGWIIVFKFKMG